jgi:hypothetical protein
LNPRKLETLFGSLIGRGSNRSHLDQG